MSGECGTYVDTRSAFSVLVWRPERKGLLERARRRWDYNIEMDMQEVG
jgi:hypothetical protein